MEKLKGFLRSPGVLASVFCLCIAFGFFLGSVYDRRSSAAVRVIARAAAETAPPAVEAVNINAADAKTLQSLPGIGSVLAERIVAYREENGPFQYLYELMNVEGIGSSVFDGLSERITLG